MIRAPRHTTIRPRSLEAAALLMLAWAAPTAHAQWSVTILQPAGATYSSANSVSDGQQVGDAGVGGIQRASLWSGSAASWLDLSPAGSTSSFASGVSGGRQVGQATVGGIVRASLWSGTAASWVDLSPAGATESFAIGILGDQQVGYSTIGGADHAGLWSGSAASWVDLNPAGSPVSWARATSGDQQVGFAYAPAEHAALWSGTAESWVDLNPAGWGASFASAVSGGRQVGVTSQNSGVLGYASLWSGTAESWVNLNPNGAFSSKALGIWGDLQVGSADFVGAGAGEHACLWHGSPASFEDLHAFLPAAFTRSWAYAVWSDANSVNVVGIGFYSQTQQFMALLWTQPIAPPQASVTEYTVGRYVSYTQSSDAPPADPESWTVIAVVATDTPDAIASASLSFDAPPPVSYDMTPANSYIWQDLAPIYNDESAFLLDYPETTYTVTVDLGAGPVSGDLFVPADLYCPEIPALTGDTFDRLQSYDPSLTFDGTINGFTLAPGTNQGSSTVTVVQVGQPGAVWSANLQPGDTAFEIPAGVLLPGTSYSIGISYFNAALTPNAGFSNATSGAQFYRQTGALFTTLPATPHEIYYYQVSKLSSFTQNSSAQPAAADYWSFAGLLFYTPDEVSSATITFDVPPLTTVDMGQSDSTLHLFYSDNYGSQVDLDSAYPSTLYTFDAERVAGPESADVFMPEDLFSPEVPYMTGNTYDRLQNIDVSQPFDLYINGFTPPPDANHVQTNLQIAEVGAGLVFSVTLSPEETYVQIPAGLLLPGTQYAFTVQYFSSVDTSDAGFQTAVSAASFIRDTNGSFTTLGPCSVAITSQPADSTVSIGDTAQFTAAGAGGTLSYQWRKDGINLSDGPSAGGGAVAGATSPVLSIVGVGVLDAGAYDVVISNTCGSATSNPAALTVTTLCAADFNGDGVVSSQDFFDFITAFFSNSLAADVNHDGQTNSQDFFDFLVAFFAGC